MGLNDGGVLECASRSSISIEVQRDSSLDDCRRFVGWCRCYKVDECIPSSYNAGSTPTNETRMQTETLFLSQATPRKTCLVASQASRASLRLEEGFSTGCFRALPWPE